MAEVRDLIVFQPHYMRVQKPIPLRSSCFIFILYSHPDEARDSSFGITTSSLFIWYNPVKGICFSSIADRVTQPLVTIDPMDASCTSKRVRSFALWQKLFSSGLARL
ncbi:predicted protein [Coccidioides posadasii str. Silveira]|uniref:Predicted protein n=1 Tax=Coccidioides posadasii (strain RMSCC 757 / Silveira) TaxID=443226 RepID=E9DHJ9_COCPS|nr:predicted protein [Coccidioides posadasii str. Silveira]